MYNFGVLQRETRWGVTAHHVDKTFDTGDIVAERRFDVDPDQETAFSLEQKSMRELVALFKTVMTNVLRDQSLPRIPQGEGTTFSRDVTEKERLIGKDDDEGLIDRKIRAFWYPPFSAATILLNGKRYYVVNEALMAEIGDRFHLK